MKYWLVLMGALFLSLAKGWGGQDVVNFGATEYPPYSGEHLVRGGLIPQVLREAYERVGYQVHIHFYPWARVVRMVKDGDLDGMVLIWMREARKGWLLYSDPMPASNALVFYKRNYTEIEFDGQDYLALKPYIIGSGRSYANPPGFELVREQLQNETVTEDIQNLRKLKSGWIDLVIIDKLVAQYLLKTQMPESLDSFSWIRPALSIEKIYVGVSKRTQQAQKKLQDFNRGLALLKQEGRIKTILAEHGFKY